MIRLRSYRQSSPGANWRSPTIFGCATLPQPKRGLPWRQKSKSTPPLWQQGSSSRQHILLVRIAHREMLIALQDAGADAIGSISHCNPAFMFVSLLDVIE